MLDARGADLGPEPKWRFRLYDASTHNFHVPEAPCLFHRVTQRIILGLVWERLDRRSLLERLMDWLAKHGGNEWSSTRPRRDM